MRFSGAKSAGTNSFTCFMKSGAIWFKSPVKFLPCATVKPIVCVSIQVGKKIFIKEKNTCKSWMRHQECLNFLEASFDSRSQRTHPWGLIVSFKQEVIDYRFIPSVSGLKCIWPVANNEQQFLEWFFIRVFQSQSTILSEEFQMLNIVFTNVLHNIVALNWRDHHAQGKNSRAIVHAALTIENALCIDQNDRHFVTVRKIMSKHFWPNPNTDRFRFSTASEFKSIHLAAVFLFTDPIRYIVAFILFDRENW